MLCQAVVIGTAPVSTSPLVVPKFTGTRSSRVLLHESACLTSRAAHTWDVREVTVALVVKVHDGIVLAADSATTLVSTMPDGSTEMYNIYNNANKLFNLHKSLPIGALTWGAGNIGPASISTLAKDLRAQFDPQVGHPRKIDQSAYEMADVAAHVKAFLYDERYEPIFGGLPPTEQPLMGFLTAGFSAGADTPKIGPVLSECVDRFALRTPAEGVSTRRMCARCKPTTAVPLRLPKQLAASIGVPGIASNASVARDHDVGDGEGHDWLPSVWSVGALRRFTAMPFLPRMATNCRASSMPSMRISGKPPTPSCTSVADITPLLSG